MSKEYFVTWEIEIVASSPAEAAEFAQRIQRDPDSEANTFKVVHGKEVNITIDLDAPYCLQCGSDDLAVACEETQTGFKCEDCDYQFKR